MIIFHTKKLFIHYRGLETDRNKHYYITDIYNAPIHKLYHIGARSALSNRTVLYTKCRRLYLNKKFTKRKEMFLNSS